MFQDLLNRAKAAWQIAAKSRALKWLQQRLLHLVQLLHLSPVQSAPNSGADSPPVRVHEPQNSLSTNVTAATVAVAERVNERAQTLKEATPAPGDRLAPARWLEGIAKNGKGRMLPWVLIPPERRYRLYIPEGISDGQPHARPRAMVVMIHGCRQDAETFAEATRMNALADRDGFVVLYPDQSDLANLHRCWNWFEPQTLAGQGETAILLTMIGLAAKRANVDTANILIAGLSSGGAMAALLAYLHPEQFARVVVHSGLAPFSANSIPNALAAMRDGPTLDMAALTRQYWRTHQLPPPPLLIIQGDADVTVSPANADVLLELWASLNQAESPAPLVRAESNTPETELNRAFRTTRLHAQDSRNTVAEQVNIVGLAHAWSGGNAAHPFNDAMGPDASGMIAAFLTSDQAPQMS